MPQTKIVCTMGPGCQDDTTLIAMMNSGMTVARLNFSHGTHEQHAGTVARLRRLSESLEHPLALLQDLSGPKIRIGDIPGGVLELKEGDPVNLTSRPENSGGSVPEVVLPFPQMIQNAHAGCRVLLDDGGIQLEVERQSETLLECRTVVGGGLQSHKGVNLPGISFPIEALTPKDLDDLKFGLAQGVDWIAMSFVRDAEDVRKLRQAITEAGSDTPIIVKVEKHEAVQNLEEIIATADGVMVARGDLGVEMPLEEVPLVQKRIIKACNAAGKPVITATQMLESMLHNPRPTRAEVTDICNAILDGTDAVMLSAETATGSYPVEAVKVMARIAERTESSLHHSEIMAARSLETGSGMADAISEGTIDIAERLKVAAIICATSSGGTARLISRFRPPCPIIASTTSARTYRQLAVSWGVTPVLVRGCETFDEMVDIAIEASLHTGRVRDGDVVLITAGSAIGIPGSTNLIKIQVVGQSDHLGRRVSWPG